MGSPAELEVARLATIVAERERGLVFANQENHRLRRERDDARREVIALSADLGSMKAREQFLKDEQDKLKQKISELEEVTKRQARTIKVQSEQIASPKEVNRTPIRGIGNPAVLLESRQQFRQQPAPVFNPQPLPQSLHTAIPQTTASVYRPQPLSNPNPPTSAPVYNPPISQPTTLQALPINRDPFTTQSTSRTLVVQSEETPQVNWIEEFSEFFDLTLTFCRNFANVPVQKRDQALSGPLLSELQRVSHPAVVQGLLSSRETRYFLVTALVNRTICEDIFRSSLVKGYSAESDQKLGEIRRNIRPNAGVSMKRGLVKAAADTLNEMRQTTDFQRWIDLQIRMKASVLWDSMESLLAPGVKREDAFDDLSEVYREAYRIGLLMYSAPITWSLDFPQNARGSVFDPTVMINKDAKFPGDPVSLRERRLRIRLAMTPVIVALNFMDEALTRRTIHFAQVLLQN